MRSAILTGLLWTSGLQGSVAKQTNPAPPISETGPSQSSSGAATAAAIDFNWVWLSLLVAVVVLGLWYIARRRQSGPPTR